MLKFLINYIYTHIYKKNSPISVQQDNQLPSSVSGAQASFSDSSCNLSGLSQAAHPQLFATG